MGKIKPRKFIRPDWFDNDVPDEFQHQAQADLAMFHIEQLNSQINNKPRRSGITTAIDAATGYDKYLQEEQAKRIENLKFWIDHFCNHAGQLGHDISNMEKALIGLKKL